MSDFADDRQLKTVFVIGADMNQVAGTVLLAYTVPAGKTALLLGIVYQEVVGTNQAAVLRFKRDGTAQQIDQFASSFDDTHRLSLEGGDAVEMAVFTQGAGGETASFLLSLEERGSNR